MIHWLATAAILPSAGYSVAKESGVDWIQDPSGKRLLSFGVCVVDAGTPFLDYDPRNPSYAAFQHYGSPQDWAADTTKRLTEWGFNTVGAWSQIEPLRAVPGSKLYYTPILHMGSSAGAPWRDMWDPAVVQMMDGLARDQIKPVAADPRVIGFFSDNEMGWWEGALFDWAWKTAGARQHVVGVMRRRYGNWTALLSDFIPSGAYSFEQLAKSGRLYLRPGGKGMEAVQEYTHVLAERYYSLCRASIKKYAPHSLYLGDRYISNYYPEVATAAADYVDILSTNLNADWNDGNFTQSYLPDLERITGKPILISEYYMSATENSSGNKNDSSGFPVVKTQAERAQGFAAATRYLFQLPYVVGAHWFQYSDEPKNGRGDGENYNFGLVDVNNQPYPDLCATSAGLRPEALHQAGSAPLPSALDGVPELSGDPNDLGSWPRDHAFVPPFGIFPRGDLYLGWSGGNLYAAFYWNEDRFPEAFYKDGKVAAADRAKIHVSVNGETIDLVAPDTDTAGSPFHRLNGVRELEVVKLPVTASAALRFEATLDTRGRAYQGHWAGTLHLSGRS